MSMNYHHYVYDYWPGEPGVSGCASCGSGGPSSFGGTELSKLFIQRRHRYRDMTYPASFGPGVFCNYDVTVQFQPIETIVNNQPTYAYRAELFDPVELTQKWVSDGVDGDTLDGIYTDQETQCIKDFRCFDVNGNVVVSPSAGTTAVLTNYPGYKYTFDLFNMAVPAPSDAKAWWKFDEGSGTTASDSSGNGNTGTLANNPSWVAGEFGDALSFNGQSNYVNAGNPADLNFQGAITLAAWINLPAQQGGGGYGGGYGGYGGGMTIQPIISHGAIVTYGPQTAAVSLYLQNGSVVAAAQNSQSQQNVSVSYALNSTEDYGYWVHWAATYDGTNWNIYRNGMLVQSEAAQLGAVTCTDDWYVGGGYSNNAGWQYFNGAIDDARIYSRALSAYEIAGLAQMPIMAGRLKSITDRNGYSITVTHKAFTQQQISQAPDLQWQIDTVTDAYGRQATFSYSPTQESGMWVVDQINFPNGHKALYNYANGQLASVAFDDGTTSTFTYGTDSASATTTVQFFDVAAEGSHRSKTIYLTHTANYGANQFTGQILTQASLLIRMVVNGAGEVAFMALLELTPDQIAYEGAGRLKQVSHNLLNFKTVDVALDGWSVPNPSAGAGGINATWFSEHNVSWANPGEGVNAWSDPQSHEWGYSFDADHFATEKTWPDGTTEQYSYNQFKQITRHQDRNSNVTLYIYDNQGNLLSKQVGLKNVNGTDTQQPEYAEYQWTYYPAGNANQYLMASAIDANGNATKFSYDNNHRLVQIIQPPDAVGDGQATTTIAYDNAGRIQQITDPMNRVVQYTYDQRDRATTITYGDSSTEAFVYGAPASGNENLLVRKKDRNGITTRFDYDAAGRVSTTTFAYSVMDQNGNETLITDPSVMVTRTCTYLPGTDLVSTSTDRGETTTYSYDYRQRIVGTTVQPRLGVALTTTKTYVDDLLFSETDPYGRNKYYAYRPDGKLIREIQGTVPSFTLADFSAVLSQTRSTAANASFLIIDYQLDNVGQRVGIIDGNGNTQAQTFDCRARVVQRVDASGTSIEATSGYLYDANGNLLEERSPRYYDSSDPQVGNCRVQMTYNARNLLSSRTEAPGTSVAATTQYSYNLDRTVATKTDARHNAWQTLWSSCCADRKTGHLDPTSAGASIEYDYAGNLTFYQTLQGTTNYTQITTQYDARRRPIFQTVWLTAAPAVDPNNPPIAGQNGVPAASGVTTQWYYDENLGDNVGLSSA